ncbi:hypothetical protein ACJX0J_032514, partial [Zea mays]
VSKGWSQSTSWCFYYFSRSTFLWPILNCSLRRIIHMTNGRISVKLFFLWFHL